LLGITKRVVAQAKRFSAEIASGVKRSSDILQQAKLHALKSQIDEMVGTVGHFKNTPTYF
jgi:IS5 family transposase